MRENLKAALDAVEATEKGDKGMDKAQGKKKAGGTLSEALGISQERYEAVKKEAFEIYQKAKCPSEFIEGVIASSWTEKEKLWTAYVIAGMIAEQEATIKGLINLLR